MPILIVVGCFFLCAMIAAYFWRGAYLEKLAPLPGETVLYEEHGIRFAELGRRGPIYYPMATVRVTNQRIITSQRTLFVKHHHRLQHVVHYAALPHTPAPDYLQGALTTGYKTFCTTKQLITFESMNDKPVIRITPAESIDFENAGFFSPCVVLIYPKSVDPFRQALGI